MSALAFLLFAVLLSALGSAILVLRQRRPTSLHSSIEAFKAEMDALAPPEHRQRTRQ